LTLVHRSDDPKNAEELARKAADRISAFATGLPKVSIREGIQTVTGDVESVKRDHRANTESDLVSLLREAAAAEEEALRR
jgi:hypothetical protein